jgi:hypothetical protein
MTSRTIAIAATNISLACVPVLDPAFMVGTLDGTDVLITTSNASIWTNLGFKVRYLVADRDHARLLVVKLLDERLRLSFNCELVVDRISQCEPIASLYHGSTRRLLLGDILSRMSGVKRAVGMQTEGDGSEAEAIREIAEYIREVIERETVLEDQIHYHIAAA